MAGSESLPLVVRLDGAVEALHLRDVVAIITSDVVLWHTAKGKRYSVYESRRHD